MKPWRSILVVSALAAFNVWSAVVPASAACHVAGFASSSIEVAESAGQVELTVVLQGGQPSCEGTVDYATQDGTAAAGSDYEEASGTLTFTSGDDRQETITIVVLADDEDEGSEDFEVVLSNPTGSISDTAGPATVTVTDDGAGDEPTDEPTADETTDDEPTADETTDDEPTATPTSEDTADDEDAGGFPWLVAVIVLVVVVGGAVAIGARGRDGGT